MPSKLTFCRDLVLIMFLRRRVFDFIFIDEILHSGHDKAVKLNESAFKASMLMTTDRLRLENGYHLLKVHEKLNRNMFLAGLNPYCLL